MNENNFQKRYSSSPQRIKDFLISEELTNVTKNIVILAKLDVNQTTQLTEMISDILIGQISLTNFPQKIESNLKVSPAQARIIIELVNKKIFEQFKEELEQYKHSEEKKPIEFRKAFETPEREVIKTEKIKEPIEPSEPPKIKPVMKEKVEQTIAEQKPPKQPLPEQPSFKKPPLEQSLPEYSFPEPSEIKVEKPVSKMGELKKVISPKVPSEQQEKIREKLLEAMQKKDAQPKIVEEMKKVSLKKPTSNEVKKEEEEPSRKKIIEEAIPSEVLAGEGKKFKDEEAPLKTKEEKPYILDVKLKEEEKRKEETPAPQEPIRYKKYQKDSPFGEA